MQNLTNHTFYSLMDLFEKVPPIDPATNLPYLVKLKGNITLSVNSNEIVKYSIIGNTVLVYINNVSILGLQGSMPTYYAEQAMRSLQNGDEVLQDFIDIFNHRTAVNGYLIYKSGTLAHFEPKLLGKILGSFCNLHYLESKLYLSSKQVSINLIYDLIKCYISPEEAEVNFSRLEGRSLNIPKQTRFSFGGTLTGKLLGNRVWVNDTMLFTIVCKQKQVYDELLNYKLKEIQLFISRYYHQIKFELLLAKTLWSKMILNQHMLRNLRLG